MRGSVYRQCWCRNPETKRRYTRKDPCPKLARAKDHGKWYARYDSAAEGRRQPVLGPFAQKKEAEEALAGALAEEGGGGSAVDRGLRAAAYLDDYMAGKRNLKPRTRETDQEALDLYWKPGLGPKIRLADVRDRHVSAVIEAMLMIGRPPAEGARQPEVLRRMIAARADDNRRVLPEGEERRKKYMRPLAPSRVERMFAPMRAAMNAAVKTGKIRRSPCDGVELPRAARARPLAWTAAREARFRAELDKRVRAAEAEVPGGRVLTTVRREAIWASPDLRPAPAMVWTPDHCGRFLDYLEDTGERLAVLYVVTAFCGMRRDEVVGLSWSEVDTDEGLLFVRETGSGDGPKSDAGTRAVPLPSPVVTALRAWRKVQAADRLSWGPDWQDTGGLVFTREEGSPVPPQWASARFETLAFRAGLPPIRFHDLRHVAASLLKAAGVDTKIISAILGHSRTSFTDAVYVTLFPDVELAAANAAAAIVPRRPRTREGGAG